MQTLLFLSKMKLSETETDINDAIGQDCHLTILTKITSAFKICKLPTFCVKQCHIFRHILAH